MKKEQQIDPRWIAWAKSQVTLLKDGGYMIFPSDGAMFQINKGRKSVDLISCRPSWIGSATEETNRQVFAKIDYRYVRDGEIPTTPEQTIKAIFGNMQKYAADLPTLMHGIGVIFRLKAENDHSDDKVNELMKKLGKKTPINPVTIRGRNVLDTGIGNLTVGRLWIGVDTVPDSPHRFNPQVQRTQRWEKPITLILSHSETDMEAVQESGSHIVVEEEEFVPAIKRLRAEPNITLKVWGKLTRLGDEPASIVFRRSQQHQDMLVSVYRGPDNSIEAGNVTLLAEKFFDGLGHLFPNGELE